jgi:hypothetical protein
VVHNDADEVEDKRVTEFGIGLQGAINYFISSGAG